MNEKLLENWLDNASERSYQAVFSQMLAAQGYTVFHSTRHCALEFGKDVLAVAPDGIGCAFQLKGNPSGRLSVDAFRREIQPQLVQLISQPPAFPGFPQRNYRAYLVTNGNVDEEVQVAIAQMNTGPYIARVELITRGILLEWATRLGAALWPAELNDELLLLQLYLSDPEDVLPREKLAGILYPLFEVDSEKPSEISAAELDRRSSSAAVLTGIATSRFMERENHVACVEAWVLYCVSLIAAVESRGMKWSRSVQASLAIGESAIFDSLAALWTEVKDREWLIEGSPLSDPEVYGWRAGVLLGMLSSLSMAASKREGLLSEVSQSELAAWLCSGKAVPNVWGEAAVASLVPWLLVFRKHDPTMRPDREISGLARLVISANQRGSVHALASPYFGIEDVPEAQMAQVLGGAAGVSLGAGGSLGIRRETFAGSSYTASSLLHLTVRTGQKAEVRSLWPEFTKLATRSFEWEEPWQFCLYRSRAGKEITTIPEPTVSWSALRASAANSATGPKLPKHLSENPWLLTLWWQVAPYRLCPASTRAVVEEYLPAWGHPV